MLFSLVHPQGYGIRRAHATFFTSNCLSKDMPNSHSCQNSVYLSSAILVFWTIQCRIPLSTSQSTRKESMLILLPPVLVMSNNDLYLGGFPKARAWFV